MLTRSDQNIMNTLGAVINGVHTDLVITDYENMIFVAITQNEKLGQFIHVDKTTSRNWDGERDVYDIKPLIGKADEWGESLARYLSEFTNPPKPVIYSILVKEDQKTVSTMEALRDIINEQNIWTSE